MAAGVHSGSLMVSPAVTRPRRPSDLLARGLHVLVGAATAFLRNGFTKASLAVLEAQISYAKIDRPRRRSSEGFGASGGGRHGSCRGRHRLGSASKFHYLRALHWDDLVIFNSRDQGRYA